MRIARKPALESAPLLAQLEPGGLALPIGSYRGEEPLCLFHKRNASEEVAVGLAFDLLHVPKSIGAVVLIPLGLGALARMGSDDPEIAVIGAQALNVHLAVRSDRQINQRVQHEVLMVPKATVVQAPKAFDAGGLVTGEKQAVASPRDSREVLMERVFQVPD